ncbi:hypothetical protein TNIN_372071 [Trichonephila inaurata madagascariensis]|uniref:Uncharacterized protein n=1 Tax=Trichonephila inaurata madagascariensis TaxID=2747483 RepID=A0A8X7CP94_9ARAC|nr:hypothetical protein TNIN_372071 [Trichonephila inaurata madagascariensis]
MLLRRQTKDEWITLKLAASIQVIEVSSLSTATNSVWSSKFDCQPLPGLFSKLVSPGLKRANHSLHRLSLIVLSLKSWLRSRND